MTNLKSILDAARAADDEVKRILAEMDESFALDTEDGTAHALDLRPSLDEAKKKAGELNQLYASMRDASSVTENAAALFVPPADPAEETSAGNGPKTMNRAAFASLDPNAKMQFMQAGGRLED
ncbi:MAG TPA: hypothetical protein DCG54_09700 [Anaerolineae bacterium]|jgi:hypothetical protein|nr:hypothetical protein [Anaerolineae bacterium]